MKKVGYIREGTAQVQIRKRMMRSCGLVEKLIWSAIILQNKRKCWANGRDYKETREQINFL